MSLRVMLAELLFEDCLVIAALRTTCLCQHCSQERMLAAEAEYKSGYSKLK